MADTGHKSKEGNTGSETSDFLEKCSQNDIVVATDNCHIADQLNFYRGEIIQLLSENQHGVWKAKTYVSYGSINTSIRKVKKIDVKTLRKPTKIPKDDWLPYCSTGTFSISLQDNEATFVYSNYGTILQAKLDLNDTKTDSEISETIHDFIWKNRNIFRFYVDDESIIYFNQFLNSNRYVRRHGVCYPYIPDWYHGYIFKRKTERMLEGKPNGLFIVSKDRPHNRYVLSVTDGQEIYHIPIEERNGEVLFENTIKTFDSVVDLVEYNFSAPLFLESEDNTLCLERWISRHDKVIPDVFSTLDPYWTELYLDTLLEGKEKQRTVRLMMVGHEGVGKTTLARNLMDRSIQDVETTNGIEVHVRTGLVETDGRWKESEPRGKDAKLVERIARMMKPVNIKDVPAQTNDIQKERYSNQSNPSPVNAITETPVNDFSQDEEKKLKTKTFPQQSIQHENRKTILHRNLSGQTIDTVKQLVGASIAHHDINLDHTVNIWDFGGQFIFYATHQLFHSPGAVYLLVLNLSKCFGDMIEYGCPMNCNGGNGRNVQDFIKFWMHSIHTFVSSETGEPPVILVGTHRDKIDGDEMLAEAHAEKYFEDVRALFDETPLLRHIQPEQFFLDNLEPEKTSLDALRSCIMTTAARQSSFDKEYPAKWIPLEQALCRVENKPFITFSEVCAIDSESDVPIANVEVIRLFLMHHHFQGLIVYFNEEELQDYVILNPQWIIDAFKCIITSRRFCKVRAHLRELWLEFENTAILKHELIEEVWKRDDENDFQADRELLLKFLVRLGILSRGRMYHDDTGKVEELDYFLVPSLLPAQRDEGIMDTLFANVTSMQMIAVFKFENSHTSPTIYHRTTAAAIGKWAVVEKCGNRLLYGNLGVYRLNMQHVGVVRLTDKTVELNVHNICCKPISGYVADSFRRFITKTIKHELNRFHSGKETRVTTTFRCSCSKQGSEKELFTTDDLKRYDSMPCLFSLPGHSINGICAYREWFVDANEFVQREKQNVRKNVGEKEIGRISNAIGKDWELLGISLGIPSAEIKQIKRDHPHPEAIQKRYMLQTWKHREGVNATMQSLFDEMKDNPAVSVDWDIIKDVYEDCFDTEVKTVY